MKTKTCIKCNIEKEVNDNNFQFRKDNNTYYNECKVCVKQYKKEYYEENKEIIAEKAKDHYEENKEEILEYQQAYREENKEKIAEYQKNYGIENRARITEYQKKYRKKKMKNDLAYRMRKNVSKIVWKWLKSRCILKNGSETWKHFTYTPQQLADHLEALFSHRDNLTADGKVWMTWDNQGTYNSKTWRDDDPTTWKWQMDHIKPHSTFLYINTRCDTYLACWALSNLRPYSAKQNIIDGSTRARHK